jgi:3'-phosphoadenosine 5'-phosphosulfate sulfotransferase (PAPS reductase)/FAD synthetase
MIDPFKISDQTCISFSGGRTSAYMLWRVLQSNGGLPSNAKVLFANTGKECEETLDFVNDCSTHWGVPITWIEYKYAEETSQRFKVVDYSSASRDGEPFAEMINQNGKPFLPNPVMRICTARLKIKPFIAYLRSLGWTDWDNMVGIRADEQRRAAKIRANPGEDGGAIKNVERILPLVDANVTKEMVGQFWKEQSFDLKLPNHNGVTMHGNCDLCFLKSASQIQSLIIEKPERAIWWAKMEEGVASATGYGPNSVFRKDRPNYSQMLKFSQDQRNMFDPNEQGIDCFCGD